MRSGEQGRECGKEVAARTVLKGGEGELEAAAWLWRALKAVAQLWRAARRRQRGYGGQGVGGIKFPQCRPYFISILGVVIFLVILNFLLVPMLIGLFPIVCIIDIIPT